MSHQHPPQPPPAHTPGPDPTYGGYYGADPPQYTPPYGEAYYSQAQPPPPYPQAPPPPRHPMGYADPASRPPRPAHSVALYVTRRALVVVAAVVLIVLVREYTRWVDAGGYYYYDDDEGDGGELGGAPRYALLAAALPVALVTFVLEIVFVFLAFGHRRDPREPGFGLRRPRRPQWRCGLYAVLAAGAAVSFAFLCVIVDGDVKLDLFPWKIEEGVVVAFMGIIMVSHAYIATEAGLEMRSEAREKNSHATIA